MFRLVIQARKNISKYCANNVKYAQKIFGIERNSISVSFVLYRSHRKDFGTTRRYNGRLIAAADDLHVGRMI